METRRLFIDAEEVKDGLIHIRDKDDIYYLSVVLRMKEGDDLFVSDGAREVYKTRIKTTEKDEIELEI